MEGGDAVPFFPAFQLSYQNKSCSEFQQDVRKSERQTNRKINRQNDSLTELQNCRAGLSFSRYFITGRFAAIEAKE